MNISTEKKAELTRICDVQSEKARSIVYNLQLKEKKSNSKWKYTDKNSLVDSLQIALQLFKFTQYYLVTEGKQALELAPLEGKLKECEEHNNLDKVDQAKKILDASQNVIACLKSNNASKSLPELIETLVESIEPKALTTKPPAIDEPESEECPYLFILIRELLLCLHYIFIQRFPIFISQFINSEEHGTRPELTR